jgi:hypothetical protein
MIMLEQPSLCLNSHDVPGPHYKMSRTVSMPRGINPTRVMAEIIGSQAAAIAQGSRLANIVINCHGYTGGNGLAIGGKGQPGLTFNNLNLLATLSGQNIAPIWLVACQAARPPAGIAFCQTLANTAQTVVIAGEDNQRLTAWQTYRYYFGLSGQIDDYEGTVYIFYPNNTYIRGVDPEKHMWSVMV